MAATYTEEEVLRRVAAAIDEERRESLRRVAAAIDEERRESSRRTDLLKNGKYFTPITKVWEQEQKQEYRGAFEEVRRADDYYKEIEEYKLVKSYLIPQNVKSGPDFDAASAVLAEVEEDQTRRGSKSSKKNEKKKTARRSSSAGTSNSSRHDNENKSESSSLATGESGREEGSQDTSQASDSSGRANKDFIGECPSSRAHLIPESDCRFSHGVACQAVCGLRLDSVAALRQLAEFIHQASHNFIRSRAVHGDMYDSKPCWILVPTCSMDKIRGWKKGDQYDVMAIAGGFGIATDEEAYKTLCTRPLHTRDDEATTEGCFKLSVCTADDIEAGRSNLEAMVLALADTLVGGKGRVSPIDLVIKGVTQSKNRVPRRPNRKKEDLQRVKKDIEENGVRVPKSLGHLLDDVKVLKFTVTPDLTDLEPDPMLLLIKAAISWSWRCGQKLLPACGSVHSEGSGDDELVSPSTPIPSFVLCTPIPVTPESDDDFF
jgi:hypothetical protein